MWKKGRGRRIRERAVLERSWKRKEKSDNKEREDLKEEATLLGETKRGGGGRAGVSHGSKQEEERKLREIKDACRREKGVSDCLGNEGGETSRD